MKKMTLGFAITVLILILFPQGSYSQQQVFGQTDKPVQISASRNGPAVFNQLGPLGYGYIASQEFTDPALMPNTSFAADDFVVPAGETWSVSYVDIVGAYFEWSGNPVYALNLMFYNDNNGMPGEVIHELAFLSEYNEIEVSPNPRICKYEITLPSAIEFTEGHYWICVQAVGDESNRWGWMTQSSPTYEYEYHWKNPGDGLGWGYTDWTPGSAISWGDYDLAFALYGEGLDNDLALVSIDQPVTGGGLTSTEQITVSIKNESTSVLTGFNLSFSVDGGAAIVENVGSFSLGANQVGQYTFIATADFSVPGLHHISASTLAAGDPIPENNTAEKEFYNLGTVYVMPSTGTQTITTCGASFTDSGGPNGNYGDNDDAVTTIFPSNSGDRIKLTFLEFDASWGGFSIYNGPDMDAPLIGTWYGTNSPGVINALNPSGSLTIHFMGPVWENTPGWVAFISCVTPVSDDFAVLEMNCSLSTIFVGDVPQLSAKIQNFGSSTQEKTVTFKANGAAIGTQLTGLLGPAEEVWVSVPWTPADAGNYLLEASVPVDAGPDPNDFITIEKQVYPFGAFFEDFEAEQFPPENWSHGGFWGRNSGGAASGQFYAQCFVGYEQSDTLITPRLLVENGGILTFAAKTSMWWPGNLDIYWINETTGVRSFVQNIALGSFGYGNFEVDLSAYAGIGRVGFFVSVTDPYAFAGNVLLDKVLGIGVTVHSDNFDLKAKNFQFNTMYNVGENTSFGITVRNDGLQGVAAGAYSVKLMRGGDVPVELQSIPGLALESREEYTYNFGVIFNEIAQFPVYVQVEYTEDEYPVNNRSQIAYINGLAGASEVVAVGDGPQFINWPIEFTLKKSLSETIYQSSEINQTGVIFGIGYPYNFKTDELNAPVRIWVGEVDASDLPEWVPATDMTLVFDGLLDVHKDRNFIYIPFQTAFNYSDGSKNLIMLTEKIGDHTNFDQIFYGYGSEYMSTLVTAGDYEIRDPYDPPSSYGLSTNINPNIRFVFNHNLGQASGTVSAQGGSPIEGARVVINELNITTYTDGSGNYAMPYVPAGDYLATAEKFAYAPLTQPLQVSFENNTDLDFTLGLLDLVSITGHITGSDNPGLGIANAVVTLTGYSNFQTTSNATGNFEIGNVYSQNTYQLSISAEGYVTHYQQIMVGGSNLNLGEIVLTEALLIPYVVMAEPSKGNMGVTWHQPSASATQIQVYEDGIHENGWASDLGEEVWLGNRIPFAEPATVTGFDIYWAWYVQSATPQPMRLDIFDANNNLIVSSEQFMSGRNEWVHVNVPNITLVGDHYAMVYWSGLNAASTFLAWDSTDIVTEYARYRYPDGEIGMLSELVGIAGTCLIRPNVMVAAKTQDSERVLAGYNIRFGQLADIANAANWPLLNETVIAGTEYNDSSWPPSANGDYVYAVQAQYTTGESEFSFSNIINLLNAGVSFSKIPEIQVYPNPASEYVMLNRVKDSELLVFGMNGTLYQTKRINVDLYKLDVSMLARGTYLLVVKNNSGMRQQKLLVN
jgi:hypothetical protein